MTDTGEKGLETLLVWQRSLAFATQICRDVLPLLPVQEKFALSEQLRRSVQSIPANVAEGYGRFYYQESIRFCYIARGSLEESFSHIKLAQNLGYLNEAICNQLNNEIQEIRRMLNGYITFLKTSKRGSTEPGATTSIREAPPLYFLNSNELPDS